MKLEEINLPAGLKKISTYAFSDCVSLEELALPEGVKEIGYGAFWNCRELSLYVPPSVKKINQNAFHGLKMLYCKKGSAVHKYAKKNKVPYKLVSAAKPASVKVKTPIEIGEVGEKGQIYASFPPAAGIRREADLQEQQAGRRLGGPVWKMDGIGFWMCCDYCKG